MHFVPYARARARARPNSPPSLFFGRVQVLPELFQTEKRCESQGDHLDERRPHFSVEFGLVSMSMDVSLVGHIHEGLFSRVLPELVVLVHSWLVFPWLVFGKHTVFDKSKMYKQP